MTTPQNQLYNLADQVKRLADMFTPVSNEEDEEAEETIFEAIRIIKSGVAHLMASYQRQENQMALIIKLLAKSEE